MPKQASVNQAISTMITKTNKNHAMQENTFALGPLIFVHLIAPHTLQIEEQTLR